MLDLKPIKDRAKIAAPGPWAWMWAGEKTNDAIVGIGVGEDGKRLLGHIDDPDDMVEAVMHLGDSKDWGNTEFIAHARTDIPALIAEVERLRALLLED